VQTEVEQTTIEATDAREAALEALLESDQGLWLAAGIEFWIAVRVVMRACACLRSR